MMMNSRNHWQWAHDDDDDDGYGDVVTSNIDSKLTELAVRNKIGSSGERRELGWH